MKPASQLENGPAATARFEDKNGIVSVAWKESGRACQSWLLNCLHSALVMEKLYACEPQPTLKMEPSCGGFIQMKAEFPIVPNNLFIRSS